MLVHQHGRGGQELLHDRSANQSRALAGATLTLLVGTKSRIFSYRWVQGSPLPKDARNPRRVSRTIKFSLLPLLLDRQRVGRRADTAGAVERRRRQEEIVAPVRDYILPI